MTSPTSRYAAWRRLSGRPGGTRLFSAAATARAQLEPPAFTQITDGSDGFELVVPVTVTDRSGTEVVHADITTWVTRVG
ncbi:DUF4442 domain-containing protein [Mycobacterium sp.]|uniref:DUF4442 domain-containing protein n=1 Tax=Mycobacterium sp. TaxID=1785 RepID=UPI003F9E5B38